MDQSRDLSGSSDIRSGPCRILMRSFAIWMAGTLWIAGRSDASDISLGVVAGDHTGISLHKNADSLVPAWHISAFFQSREFLQLNADLQYDLRPNALNLNMVQGVLYSGLGLRVVSLAHRSREEAYWFRLPVGIMAQIHPLRLDIFFEISALMGPLPSTGMTMSPGAGLRIWL